MHRFAIASLIAALIGGCRKEPTSESGPEAVATAAVAEPAPKPERTEHLTLLALCESGEATPERIQEFLDLRADVNAKNEIGGTPLHCAAEYDENIEVVTTLIKAGANVNAKDTFGETPLHPAAEISENLEVVTTLIKAGADVNAKSKVGFTPLHYAASNNKNPRMFNDSTRAAASP